MAFLNDRRRHPRYPVNLPVFIFYGDKRAVGHTLNLGLGGMKIFTDKVFPSRREFLFQLVLKRKSIWVKGQFVFEQNYPEFLNFSSVRFEETKTESIINLQEFLSHTQNLLTNDYVDLEVRIREKEAALAKANELSKVETERRERAELVIKELGERLEYLSAEVSDDRDNRLRMTAQELDGRIEGLLLAIIDGLRNIHLLLKEANGVDQISFEHIISSIQNNYTEIRRVLED